MIEIPSIALIAEKVTGEVDFASIGTNDLCQYLMAADRLNPEVAEYYKSYHPALFKIISLVSRAFLKAEKKISICGEMGGDPLAISAFIGMGINKFSMVKSAIPVVKQLITTLDFSETQELAETVINMSSVQEVKNALNDFYTNCSSNKEGVHVFKKSCITLRVASNAISSRSISAGSIKQILCISSGSILRSGRCGIENVKYKSHV
jgi:phosphotransferase system enzyme I (PtsI)